MSHKKGIKKNKKDIKLKKENLKTNIKLLREKIKNKKMLRHENVDIKNGKTESLDETETVFGISDNCKEECNRNNNIKVVELNDEIAEQINNINGIDGQNNNENGKDEQHNNENGKDEQNNNVNVKAEQIKNKSDSIMMEKETNDQSKETDENSNERPIIDESANFIKTEGDDKIKSIDEIPKECEIVEKTDISLNKNENSKTEQKTDEIDEKETSKDSTDKNYDQILESNENIETSSDQKNTEKKKKKKQKKLTVTKDTKNKKEFYKNKYLRALTKKNTKLNSGYKTIKIIHDKKIYFPGELTYEKEKRWVQAEKKSESKIKIESNLKECKKIKNFKYNGKKQQIVVKKIFKNDGIDREFLYRKL